MKLLICLPIVAAFFSLETARSQTSGGTFGLSVNAGLPIPISSSMRGTVEGWGALTTQYPFGEESLEAFSWGIAGIYQCAASPVEFLVSMQRTTFNVDPDASLRILSFGAGGGYGIGDRSEGWTGYGRASALLSVIDGRFLYPLHPEILGPFVEQPQDLETAVRVGFALEGGGGYRIAETPVGLEASVVYSNVNVIGREFSTVATDDESTTRLNDGANPNDPNHTGRTIDMVTIRGGVRWWF